MFRFSGCPRRRSAILTISGICLRQIRRALFAGKSYTPIIFDVVNNFEDCTILAPSKWDTMYACAKVYYDEHGDCRLPMRYTDSQGENLYDWLCNQKQYAKQGKMSAERKRLLVAINAIAMQ